MARRIGMAKVKAPFPVVAGFNWSVGKLMEGFIKAFARKQILGVKCPKCGYTYVPPRNLCGKCHSRISEADLVEMSGRGALVSYTVAHVELDGSGNYRELGEPKVIGAVVLEGADSTIFVPVEGVRPKQLKVDMPVEVVWAENPEGKLSDMRCFKPVGR